MMTGYGVTASGLITGGIMDGYRGKKYKTNINITLSGPGMPGLYRQPKKMSENLPMVVQYTSGE